MTSSIKRNLIWMLLCQAATWIVSTSVLLIAPRVLGKQGFGQLSFVIIFVAFFELLATMGTNTFLVKAVARDSGNVGRYVANTVAMKLLMTTVLVFVALGLGLALGLPDLELRLIAAYCAGMVLNIVGITIGAALTGLQLMPGLARWNMVQCYVGGIGGLAILLHTHSVIAYAIVFNLSFVIPIAPNLRKLWPYIRDDCSLDVRLWPEILRGGLPFFVLAGLIVVYGTVDVPLLRAMTGSEEEVGWYVLAYRWVSLPAFFAATVSGVVFPALSADGVRVTDSFVALANRALRLVVFVATPAAIGIALIATSFVTLLYPAEYTPAIPLLRILALHIPIVSMDILLGSIAMASDRQRQWVMVSVAATLFNPLLNLVAIPQSQRLFHNGAIGAAFVTVLTELLLMGGAIALRPRGVLDRSTVNMALRIILASLAMVPVVFALGSAPVGVLVGAGVVTYAVASFALGTLTIAEVKGWVARLRVRGTRAPQVSVAGAPSLEILTTATAIDGVPPSDRHDPPSAQRPRAPELLMEPAR